MVILLRKILAQNPLKHRDRIHRRAGSVRDRQGAIVSMNSQRFRRAAATASKSARSIRLNSKDRAQYILLMMLKKKIALVTGRSQGLMNNTFRTLLIWGNFG